MPHLPIGQKQLSLLVCQKSLELGADLFMTKPFEINALLQNLVELSKKIKKLEKQVEELKNMTAQLAVVQEKKESHP